ncbi:site-specific tyrosine recombinase/integron integrase [Bifidobacterium boum]|nr:site-specific tyrosine recombinase/integron integrase [Bifidobacterium boum]
METIINAVLAQMQPFLDGFQFKQLAVSLKAAFENAERPPQQDRGDLLELFLTAKEVEGCSPKTIAYYRTTLEHMTATIAKPYTQMTSEDLRDYLNGYGSRHGAGKVTIDNIRRIMSSFFSWLEDEDYVVKSPVRRIHRIKTAQVTKEVLTDEQIESLRDGCSCVRDLAIIDVLASSGMRVGELVGLDISDVNLQERECIVTGKGNKQRPVYLDARAKLHLSDYLKTRRDDNPALFVTLRGRMKRMTVSDVEARVRELGRATQVGRVHPHKFRRTLATRAIDRGMPIEQVQKLLGHAKIDTTMHYAMVDQNNVKTSHRKYLE